MNLQEFSTIENPLPVELSFVCNYQCVLSFQGYPAEFAMYLNYCRGLRFEEAPDYMYLRQLFRILFRTLNHQYDYVFDWTILKQKAAITANSSQQAMPGKLAFKDSIYDNNKSRFRISEIYILYQKLCDNDFNTTPILFPRKMND